MEEYETFISVILKIMRAFIKVCIVRIQKVIILLWEILS